LHVLLSWKILWRLELSDFELGTVKFFTEGGGAGSQGVNVCLRRYRVATHFLLNHLYGSRLEAVVMAQ
jgi:hypothetical protein